MERISSEVLLLCHFRGRRDSDGWEETEAYSAKEAGRMMSRNVREYAKISVNRISCDKIYA
jgi:hypothetical protein